MLVKEDFYECLPQPRWHDYYGKRNTAILPNCPRHIVIVKEAEEIRKEFCDFINSFMNSLCLASPPIKCFHVTGCWQLWSSSSSSSARQMQPSYLFLLFCTYVLFISLAIEEIRVSGPFGLIDFRPEPTQLLRQSKCTLHQVWHIIRR